MIEVAEFEGWARLTLARPEKRNAMNREMRAELAATLARLEGDTRALVLAGQGAVFCAGLDLKERQADADDGRPEEAGAEWRALALALRRHPAAVIVALEGLALGAGATLVGLADLCIAGAEAAIGLPEIGLGRYASLSGPLMQGRLGHGRAAWLLLSGERIDAATARDWGLANEVVPAGTALARAEVLAARIAGHDGAAVAEIKRALDTAPPASAGLEAGFAFGAEVNARILARSDAQIRAHRAFADRGARAEGGA